MNSLIVKKAIEIVENTEFRGAACIKIANTLEVLSVLANILDGKEQEDLKRSESMENQDWEVKEVNGDAQLTKGEQVYLVRDSEILLNGRPLGFGEFGQFWDAFCNIAKEEGESRIRKSIKSDLLALAQKPQEPEQKEEPKAPEDHTQA